MGSDYEIKLLSKETADEQISVYMKSFQKKESFEAIKEIWQKEHYENPLHESYVFGAYDHERIVSMNAYMPMRYHIGDRMVNVIQSCESGTLPEYRGKGLWSKVVTYAINYFKEEGEYDFLIGFPNYENSFGGFIKMKWNHDADIINYIMIVNGKSFIRAITGKGINIFNILGLQKFKLAKKTTKKYSIIPYVYVDKYLRGGSFDVELSKQFIEWKIKYKEINCFSIKDNNTSNVASCFYSIGKFKGEKIVILHRIVDYSGMCNLKELYSVAVQEIIKNNKDVAFIRTWVMPNSVCEKSIKSIGFLKSKHHNPFVTFCLKNNVVSEAEVRNALNWDNLSFLDLD